MKQTSHLHCCIGLHGVHRDSLTFTFTFLILVLSGIKSLASYCGIMYSPVEIMQAYVFFLFLCLVTELNHFYEILYECYVIEVYHMIVLVTTNIVVV